VYVNLLYALYIFERTTLTLCVACLQGPENIAQLTNEVKLMTKLSHPNIVKLHATDKKAIGRDGYEIFVVLEYCPGGHLLARLNKLAESGGTLPFPKLVDVFLQIVRPVAYLHAMTPPVAHRDLKFENVLIAVDGSLRLCDFGSCSTHTVRAPPPRFTSRQRIVIVQWFPVPCRVLWMIRRIGPSRRTPYRDTRHHISDRRK
jgi:serine/threonine protein kinase